jgi:hypothetical protein
LGARKTNGINRRAKIWEQEKQIVSTGDPKSGSKKNKWYKQESQNLGARKTNLALLFIPFVFLAPRIWISCLYHLFFLLPDFGSPVYIFCFSCSQILALLFIPESQNLGARKTNGINRRSKIWEQEKQMV